MKPGISLTIGIWNPRFMDKEYWIQYPPSGIYSIKSISAIHNVRSRSQDSRGCTLYLEECQPVSRRVSFHKRRSSVRKSEKDAICSHLIQAADNVPRKLKFLTFATFYIGLLNSMCRIDLVTAPTRLNRGIHWNKDIPLTRKVCMWSVWWAKCQDFGWTKVTCRYFFEFTELFVL